MAITVGRSYDANYNYIGNGAGQWTVVAPTAGFHDGYSATTPSTVSNLIYVSNTYAGNSNSNSGSSTSPVTDITTGFGLLRSGSPDWLLLRKGDTWTNQQLIINKSGQNNLNPMVFCSYSSTGITGTTPRGTGTGARPKLFFTSDPSTTGAIGAWPGSDNIAVIGIETDCNSQCHVGIVGYNHTMTFYLIEDCKVTNPVDDGFIFRGNDTSVAPTLPYSQLTFILRRNAVTSGWGSSGILCGGCPNSIIEENVVNGPGYGWVSQFMHCVYLGTRLPNSDPYTPGSEGGALTPNTGILSNVTPMGGNILMNEAGTSGSNIRSGGILIDNLHMSQEYGFNVSYPTDTGQPTVVVNNVSLGARGGSACSGSAQITTENAASTNPPTLHGDIITSTAPNGGLIIRNNIQTAPDTSVNGSSLGSIYIRPIPFDYITGINNICVTYDNIDCGGVPSGINDQSGGPHNSYSTNYGQAWTSYGGTPVWSGGAPPGMLTNGNNKTLTDYMNQTSPPLSPATFANFTALALLQSHDNWDTRLTANSVNNYFRTQFNLPYYALAPSITISPSTVPNGTVGVAYNGGVAINFTASGGTAPYTWTHSGTVPPGLNFNDAAATLSGTPTSAVGSPFTFTVNATDSAGAPVTGSQSYTVTITAPAITITPSSLPPGKVGTVYNQTIVASGGTAPYTYSIVSGSLPPGLGTFPNSTGIISGTPTLNGTFPFTLRATDSASTTQDQPYTLLISPTDVVLPSSPLGAICM